MKKKENKRAESKGQRAKSIGQSAKNAKMHECENARMHECGTTDNNLSVTPPAPLDPLKGSSQISGEMSGTVRGISPSVDGVRGSEGMEMKINRISTVLHIKKPSAIGMLFPAKGCISGSRAIKACLMIRVFNN